MEGNASRDSINFFPPSDRIERGYIRFFLFYFRLFLGKLYLKYIDSEFLGAQQVGVPSLNIPSFPLFACSMIRKKRFLPTGRMGCWSWRLTARASARRRERGFLTLQAVARCNGKYARECFLTASNTCVAKVRFSLCIYYFF